MSSGVVGQAHPRDDVIETTTYVWESNYGDEYGSVAYLNVDQNETAYVRGILTSEAGLTGAGSQMMSSSACPEGFNATSLDDSIATATVQGEDVLVEPEGSGETSILLECRDFVSDEAYVAIAPVHVHETDQSIDETGIGQLGIMIIVILFGSWLSLWKWRRSSDSYAIIPVILSLLSVVLVISWTMGVSESLWVWFAIVMAFISLIVNVAIDEGFV